MFLLGRVRIVPALVAGPLLLAPPVAAQAFPGDSAIRAMVLPWIEQGRIAGVVVGLTENGRQRIIAAGRRGVPGSPAPDARTVFEIGSATKVFTGIVLGDMVERGEVALEDPVAKYLPPGTKVPSRGGREITLLDLATHTSGLPRLPSNLRPADGANPYADYTPALLYEFLAAHTLGRDPGASYEYSNLGMGFLGHALWRRAGRDLESLYQERILRPLGLRDTRIRLTPELEARLAQGHDASLAPAGKWDMPTLAGAGALSSTAADMLRFLEANLNGAPGTLGRAMAAAREPRRPAGGPMQIGLGWHILQTGTRRIVWHNGGTGGYHSFVGFDPDGRRGVVILINTAASLDELGFHLLDPSRPYAPPRPWPATVALTPAQLDALTGEYQLAPGFSITVIREGDQAFAQATGQPRFPIFADSDSTFYLRVVEARLTFRRDSTGRVGGLVLHQGGRDLPGRRVP